MTRRLHTGCGLVVLATAVCVALLTPPAGHTGTEPTRLLGGPVLFRLTGYQHLPPSNGRKLWRYLMVFRLSRALGPRDPSDEDPGRTRYGNYSVHGTALAPDDLIQRARPSNCLVFTPVQFDRWSVLLKKIKAGRRVKVTLRPYTGTADGSLKLGRTYTVRPRLRRVDMRLRDPVARRELKRIGCLGPLKHYGK